MSPSTTSVREHKFVKVFRLCPPGFFPRMEKLLALHHPSLHPYQDIGWLNQHNSFYLLSQYEERGSLARYLASKTPLPLSMITSMLLQMAHTLQYLHKHNLVHGRVRPENCLIVDRARVQVSDFYHGLLTREITVEPSPYTAPEQLRGIYLPSSDQYALAVLTCQLLACHLHFPRIESTNGKQTQNQPWVVQPDKILHALPLSAQQTLVRALSKAAEQRFPEIVEFATTLQRSLGQDRQSQPSETTWSVSRPTPLVLPEPASSPLPQNTRPVQALNNSRSNTSEIPRQTREQRQPVLAAPPARLPGHTSGISALRWAADGKYLASAGLDRQIMVWFIQQRASAPMIAVTGHDAVIKALSWSTDSRLLASAADDGSIRLWHVSTTPSFQMKGAASWQGHDAGITAIEWAPVGQLIASGGRDQLLHLWDTQGNKLASWQAHGQEGVTALAWSPDGRTIASGGADGQIYLWDVSNGRRIWHFIGDRDEIHHLRWSPDGRLLVSSAGKKDTQITVWDVQTQQRRSVFTGHKREVVGLFWSSDHTWLISVGADCTIHYWNKTRPAETVPGKRLEMSGTPLVMDGSTATNMFTVGTSDRLMLLFQVK